MAAQGHSPAMKHKKTVADIFSSERHRSRDQKIDIGSLVFFFDFKACYLWLLIAWI